MNRTFRTFGPTVVLSVIASFWPIHANAALANDQCAGAIGVGVSSTTVLSTLGADSSGDPVPPCVGSPANGIWYTFTAPISAQLVIDTIGSTFDTVLSVYRGSCNALTFVACDDDAGGNLTSKVTIQLIGGSTYYILVGGFSGSTGNAILNLLPSVPPPVVIINSSDRGWYSHNGLHDPAINNYAAGEFSNATNRNFFVFNLPGFVGVIAKAELLIKCYQIGTPNVFEVITFSDVTNSIATLVAGGASKTNVYHDLGTGTNFGSAFLTPANSGTTVVVPLNAAFIHAALAASSGQIAIGGSVTTLDPSPENEYVFGFSAGESSDIQLRLTFANSITVAATDKGAYDESGYHDPLNSEYVAGDRPFFPGTFNNFFVFPVPLFKGSLIHAELLVDSYNNVSPTGSERLMLRQVTTPVSTLKSGGAGLTGVFSDLANGPVYGLRDLNVLESGRTTIIPLNATFINAASLLRGSEIAMGGAVISLDSSPGDERVFESSGQIQSDVRLRLTFGSSLQFSSTDKGTYDQTGGHNPDSQNYIAGEPIGGPEQRNWFVFDIPPLAGPVVNANIILTSYTDAHSSPDDFEHLRLRHVSTPISTLRAGGSGLTAVFADLADGPIYGGRDFYLFETNTQVAIPLLPSFLTDVTAASGAQIALGGALTSLNPTPSDERLFAISGLVASEAQLFLGMAGQWAPVPSFAPGNPVIIGDGILSFTVNGSTGTMFEIQSSIDWVNWCAGQTILLTNNSASVSYTNHYAPKLFFRTRLIP